MYLKNVHSYVTPFPTRRSSELLLNLRDHVAVHGLAARDAEDVLRVRGAFAEEVTRRDLLAVVDPEARLVGDLVDPLLDLLHRDGDLAAALDLDRAGHRRRHVDLALRAALGLGEGLARGHVRAVLDVEHVAGRDADRDRVLLHVADDDLS